MRIVLFSTGCPKCKVLEKKLLQKNMVYEEVNDVDVMTEKGFMSVPMLEVDGEVMDFKAASDWINTI